VSKAHLLSFHSKGRHCHSWWLWLSRHFQWLVNCAKQFLLRSSILQLPMISNPFPISRDSQLVLWPVVSSSMGKT
jgi:hypothetical protein